MKITKGKFTGKVINEGGKRTLSIKNPDLWDKFLSNFTEEDLLDIEIKKWKENRSRKQNNYYWGVVVMMISEHTGFETEETHEVLKRKFLRYIKEYKGKRYWFTRSTVDLKTDEFVEYIDKIRRFASQELGVVIPDPDGDTYWY